MALGAGAAENHDAARDSIPSRWTYRPDYVQPLPVAAAWWRSFDDPVIDSLISLAIDNNFDVAMAFRRMEMASQAIRSAKSGYYPQLSVSAGYTASRTSGYPSGRIQHGRSGRRYRRGPQGLPPRDFRAGTHRLRLPAPETSV